MALSKIDVANMVTGATPVANGGTGQTTFAAAGLAKRPNATSLIINGDMAVAQRATSVAGLTNGRDVYVALDRFGFNEFGSPSSQHTMTQESLTSGNAYINGFANALKMDVTTAQGSLDADDATMIIYKFEGQDLQLFKKGTANAEKFTLAFWVKSTKTGTHVVELFDKDNTRHVSGTYSISTTNTWEHKVVVFPADTTGVFGDDNARSLDINWFLSAGTNYTSGTLQTSWGGQADTTRAVGQVNTVDNTSNNWHITGVQLEVGEYTSATLPPFQHESFEDNLKRCERYFQVIAKKESGDNEDAVLPFAQYSGSTIYGVYNFRTEMRTAPSLSCANGTNYFRWFRQNSNTEFNTFVLDKSSPQNCDLYQNVSGTQGSAGWVRMINNAPDGSLVALNGEL